MTKTPTQRVNDCALSLVPDAWDVGRLVIVARTLAAELEAAQRALPDEGEVKRLRAELDAVMEELEWDNDEYHAPQTRLECAQSWTAAHKRMRREIVEARNRAEAAEAKLAELYAAIDAAMKESKP